VLVGLFEASELGQFVPEFDEMKVKIELGFEVG